MRAPEFGYFLAETKHLPVWSGAYPGSPTMAACGLPAIRPCSPHRLQKSAGKFRAKGGPACSRLPVYLLEDKPDACAPRSGFVKKSGDSKLQGRSDGLSGCPDFAGRPLCELDAKVDFRICLANRLEYFAPRKNSKLREKV